MNDLNEPLTDGDKLFLIAFIVGLILIYVLS